MRNFTRSIAVIALLSIASMAMAEAPELYPQPFPGTINSTFGPRVTETKDKKDYTPGFHGGLDFLRVAGTSIPAAADGYVDEINTDLNFGGIRLWLKTKDNVDLGYMHLFSYNDATRKNRSGTFVLLRKQPYLIKKAKTIAIGPSVLPYFEYVKCSTILNTETNIALVPKACAFAEGEILALDPLNSKQLFTVTNKVEAGSLIAPVGTSAAIVEEKKTTVSEVGEHLHLQRGKKGNTRHPLGIFSPINDAGNFCARLGDANTNPPFADALNCGSTATVPPYDLTTRPYIDVRVDATIRLDLDGAAFEVSGSPVQQYSVLFGPPAVNGTLMKDTKEMVSDVVRKPNCSDNQIPQSGDLLICANHWKGQPSRLERVFRLGVDPAPVPKGCNSVDVKLIRAAQGTTEGFKLNFKNGEGKPKAVNDLASTKINTPVTIAIKANDTNADNQPLKDGDVTITLTLADPSKGTVVDNSDGTITFTPNVGVTGAVVINYQLITPCGDKSNLASVTVNVTNSATAHWAGGYSIGKCDFYPEIGFEWWGLLPCAAALPPRGAGFGFFYFDDQSSDVIFEISVFEGSVRSIANLGWRSTSNTFSHSIPMGYFIDDFSSGIISAKGALTYTFTVIWRTESQISGTFIATMNPVYFKHGKLIQIPVQMTGSWEAHLMAGQKPQTLMNGYDLCLDFLNSGAVLSPFPNPETNSSILPDWESWVPNGCKYQ